MPHGAMYCWPGARVRTRTRPSASRTRSVNCGVDPLIPDQTIQAIRERSDSHGDPAGIAPKAGPGRQPQLRLVDQRSPYCEVRMRPGGVRAGLRAGIGRADLHPQPVAVEGVDQLAGQHERPARLSVQGVPQPQATLLVGDGLQFAQRVRPWMALPAAGSVSASS